MIEDLKLKIKYLTERCSYQDLGFFCNTSGSKLKDIVERNEDRLSALARARVNSQFEKEAISEKLDALRVKYRGVKNYDDDESLEDLKTSTSRHGVNRSSSSFSTNNNGYSL